MNDLATGIEAAKNLIFLPRKRLGIRPEEIEGFNFH